MRMSIKFPGPGRYIKQRRQVEEGGSTVGTDCHERGLACDALADAFLEHRGPTEQGSGAICLGMDWAIINGMHRKHPLYGWTGTP